MHACKNMAKTQSLMVQSLQVQEEIAGGSTLYAGKKKGIRGRQMGKGQAAAGGARVRGKVFTRGFMEDEVDEDDEEEGEGGEGAADVFVRSVGRDGVGAEEAEQLAPPPGFVKEAPMEGEDLVGWVSQVVYPTGPNSELRWHKAFVMSEGIVRDASGMMQQQYSMFVPVDEEEEAGITLPDPTVCFRRKNLPGTRVSHQVLMDARRTMVQRAVNEYCNEV
jgi:hypothetical protein